MKVLTLGSDTQAKEMLPPDTEFDKAYRPEKHGYYDIIFLGHYLQFKDRKEVGPFLRNLRDCLVEDGELWVSVPSLEYAALQILKDDSPSFDAFTAIYGDDNHPHKCGFRLLELRLVVMNAGYEIRRAIQEAYKISMTTKDGTQEMLSMQNLVIAAKHDGNPAEAIG